MMLISGRLIWFSAAKSVVDLPEPVGPVTSSAPVGRATISESVARISSERPSSSSVGGFFDLSSRRMTSDSPSTVGSVATRTSSIRPAAAAFSEMRPSCGFRRSAMSSFASTFRRVVTPGISRFGMRCISCSTPSMRNRTTSASSCGSKWMSEAPSSAAWKRIELTRRTSGTSETPSSASRSVTSSSSARGSPPARRRSRARRTPRRRVRACGARRGCPRARRRRARATTASRAGARRCRAGSRDRRRRCAARRPRGVRDRADALEDVQRDLLRRVLVDADEREVDERQLVPGGEHPRDALAGGDALLDERRGERACLLRPAAREREPVLRNELRRGEQVDDELDRLADAVRRGQRLAAGDPGLGAAAERRMGLSFSLTGCGW